MYTELTHYGGHELAEAVSELYKTGQTDYYLEPIILTDPRGDPVGRIREGDSVIFCLRRGEREIQLTEAFTDPTVGNFNRVNFEDLHFVILTMYHEKFKDLPVAFAPTKIKNTLAEVISKAGLHQLHIAESEKFSHVTYFLNGGNHQPFQSETDIRIPSLKGIPLDQVPELSLPEISKQVIKGLNDRYAFLVVNFANGDVIGHTSNQNAKIKCAEVIDAHLINVIIAALALHYAVIITADHGNLEVMCNADGSPNVSHTNNPVPFIFIDPEYGNPINLNPGSLADIAPTVLARLRIPKPDDMTGKDLIVGYDNADQRKVLLIIVDGWGIGKEDSSNPIYLAQTPHWDQLLKAYPNTRLLAAGEAVGLKPGKNGNSEAGHMNIGAGRIILQDDVRLDAAMLDGSFYTNEVFINAIVNVKKFNSRLHLIGLLSEKSSHGSIDYPLALLKIAKKYDIRDVYIHMIFDGRSTDPGSAPQLLREFEQKMKEIGIGKIVTGMGREFALDRDGDYHKTQCAYDALVYGRGNKFQVNYY